MTKTPRQAAALVLSAVVAIGTLAGMNALAAQQYRAANVAAVAQLPRLAMQTVVIVGHRVAKA